MITFDLMYDNLVVMTIIIMSAEAFIFSLIESGDEEELLAKLQELEDAQNSLSYRNNQGKTALDLAALLGKAGCAQVLVENGADLNKANTSGTNNLTISLESPKKYAKHFSTASVNVGTPTLGPF